MRYTLWHHVYASKAILQPSHKDLRPKNRDCCRRRAKDSLFPALKKCDVGAFGIKPFAAGSLFTGEREEDYQRARLALRYILLSNTVIPIPGINSIAEADNLARAAAERRELDVKEKAAVKSMSRDMWSKLPNNYQWLKNWEYV